MLNLQYYLTFVPWPCMLLYGIVVIAPGEIRDYKILLIRKCSLTLIATSYGVSAYKKEDVQCFGR